MDAARGHDGVRTSADGSDPIGADRPRF